MKEGHRPLEQLDVPLVWDRRPGDLQPPRAEPGPRATRPAARWSRLRLWVAALADLGAVVLFLVVSWGLAMAQGTSLAPGQLVLAGAAGLLAAGALGVGTLWGWRATPGMALLHLRFASPLAVGRAHRVWVGWLAALLLAGVPLLVGRRGRTLAELLAGVEIGAH